MSRLPSLRPRAVVSALERDGFQKILQEGSHLHLQHGDGREVVVPMHARELKRGTLLAIVKQAGYTAETFQELL